MTTLLNGLLGGLIVGVLAAGAAQLLRADPPATALLLGLPAGDGRWARLRDALVQVGYGTLAGGALVVLELLVLNAVGVPASNAEAFPLAIGWAAVLLVLSLAALRVAVDRTPARPQAVEVLVYHVVFGLGMGAWISLTWYT